MIKRTQKILVSLLFVFSVILIGSFSFVLSTIAGIGSHEVKAASSEYRYVYDGLGLFSESEADHLEELAEEYGKENDLNFIIVTTNYESGRSSYDPIVQDTQDFAEMFYQEYYAYYGSDGEDCVIFTINIVDEYDREYGRYAYISGYEEGSYKMSNDRCDLLFEKVKPDLSSGNYYSAAVLFLEKVTKYVKVKEGVNPESIFFKLWFQIVISLAIGGIIILIMIHNSKGKMTASGSTYIDPGNSKVLGHYDRYIRTVTTKTRIQSSSGGGGRSGGGGGGRSGGGGHF